MEQKYFAVNNNSNVGRYNVALGFNQRGEINPFKLDKNSDLDLLSFANLESVDDETEYVSPYFLSDFVEAAIEDLRVDCGKTSGLKSSLFLRKIDDLQFAKKNIEGSYKESTDLRVWGYFALLGEDNVPYKLVETFPNRISERGLVGLIGDLANSNQIKGSEICIMGVPDEIMNYNISNKDITQLNLTKH